MALSLTFYLSGGMQPATALVFGPDAETSGTPLDVIVAVVDDDIITRHELDAAIQRIERRARQKGQTLPPRPVLEYQVLENLILTKLQLRAAERNGIVVDDPTLNAALENLARQNNLTLGQLRETFEKDGMSLADVREEIRREILFTRLRQRLVDSTIQVPEQEVETLLTAAPAGAAGATQYHLAHILIAAPADASAAEIEVAQRKARQIAKQLSQGADFQRLAATVSDDRQAREGGDLGWRAAGQLPAAYVKAAAELKPGQSSEVIRTPVGFHIIKLLEVKEAAAVNSPENQAAAPVQAHRVRHIMIKTNELVSDTDAQQRLQRIAERVQQGEDFAVLAGEYSEDAASAAKGGDLGWVTPAELGPEFALELSKLQPADVSAPFKSRSGWHIVQLVERRQATDDVENRRAQARETLFKRRIQEEWNLWLRRMRDEAYVEIRLPKPQATP